MDQRHPYRNAQHDPRVGVPGLSKRNPQPENRKCQQNPVEQPVSSNETGRRPFVIDGRVSRGKPPEIVQLLEATPEKPRRVLPDIAERFFPEERVLLGLGRVGDLVPELRRSSLELSSTVQGQTGPGAVGIISPPERPRQLSGYPHRYYWLLTRI